jgi:hypothetical protein
MRSSLTIWTIEPGWRSAPARFGRSPPRRSDDLPPLALQRRLARTATPGRGARCYARTSGRPTRSACPGVGNASASSCTSSSHAPT